MSRAQRNWSEWALIAVVLMVPLGAQALGLGEARVESFLNQPLDVRMRLLDANEDNLDSLTVAPASPADYERLGLMSDSLGLNLEVRLDRSVSPPVVRVTSDRVVTDPVVQLLIDARWSSGRVLREYTLFLDPATVAVEAPAPAPAQSDESASSDVEPEPDRAAQPASPTARSQDTAAPDRPAAAASSGAGTYGPVDSGETLWSIARANLPSGEVTMNQMMIAIVELNPSAFRDRNINQLLRGAELRIPDAEQAMSRDAAAVAAEVAAQNRAFQRRATGDTPVVSAAGRDDASGAADEPTSGAADNAPTDTSARTSAADGAGDGSVDHRLSLVPPDEEEAGSGLSDQDASEVADLRQRLARAEEELYAARQEAEEFQSRVEELESLARDNPGALGLRDAELAGLQETLRAAREATREDADPSLRARVSQRLDEYLEESVAASAGADAQSAEASGSASGPNDSSAGATPEADVSESDAESTAQVAPERAVTRIERSGGLLSNPMLMLFVGLVLLLLLLAGVRIALRRRAARETETSRPTVGQAATPAQPAGGVETPADRARARVEARPTDLAAHLGLLQSLGTAGNEARFGEALEQMFEHVESGEEPEWREALELADRVMPDHPLVKGSSDWVPDSEEPGRLEPASDIDAESEVDELMSRLDADLEESDDQDLPREEASEEPMPEGTLLREVEDGAATAARERSSETEDDAPIDFSDLEEADEPGRLPEDEQPGDRGENEDIDNLVLDWDDGEEADRTRDADTRASGGPQAADLEEAPILSADEADEVDDTEDDIFAQSDDDIDVKLDLAKAYLSWNSTDSARTLLEEVAREGNESQQQEARKLIDEAGGGRED